ncbi:universal stress protein [Labilibacter sediminis]|nr:universal stress protein [Labilibacter sediminis]
MIIRFLVPVNFAPYTINALNYCMSLSERFKGEITLLYCYTHMLSDDNLPSSEEPYIKSMDQAMENLEQLKAGILEKSGNSENIQIKTRILEGYPEDVIPDFCAKYSPDLIVMGTKSVGETIKELLGSVTLDVIKKVSFPVLAVPNGYDLNLNKLNNILFVTDFEKCEYTPLHKLVRLTMSFNTVIHNVQYCQGGKEKSDIDLLNDYSDYCKSTYRNQNMTCEYIYGSNILTAIKDYLIGTDIDLLAITRKKRNLISQMIHPSITKQILFNTDIPMLFFHI